MRFFSVLLAAIVAASGLVAAGDRCRKTEMIHYAIEVTMIPLPDECDNDDLYWISFLIEYYINRIFSQVGEQYDIIESDNFICMDDRRLNEVRILTNSSFPEEPRDVGIQQLRQLRGLNHSFSNFPSVQRQRKALSKFIFYGGGWCILCNKDDDDKRRILFPKAPVLAPAPIPRKPGLSTLGQNQLSAPVNHRHLCEESVIEFENFEDSNHTEWSEGKVHTAGELGSFMGMYRGHSEPRKTFLVPEDAGLIRFEADFYEIDWWAGCSAGFGPDYLNLYINEEKLSLGCFFRAEDEKTREGRTTGGIQWVMYSLDPPEHLCCNQAAVDQRHRIVAYIPQSFYNRNGELRVRFDVNLLKVEGVHKAAGFDNIAIVAQTCPNARIQAPSPPTPKSSAIEQLPPGQCSKFRTRVLSYENFETQRTTGWTNAKITRGNALTYFLGRYGDRGSPSKVYKVSKNYPEVEVRFDFYELDAWNGSHDSLAVFINKIKIDLGTFKATKDEGGRTGVVTGGMTWKMWSLRRPKQYDFGDAVDQAHRIQITVPQKIYEQTGRIEVMFYVTNVDSDVETKSAGFDNVKISAKQCAKDKVKTPVPVRQPTKKLKKCKSTKYHTVSFEDFEDGYTTDWLPGFSEYRPNFSTFLGRYGQSSSPKTQKTYKLPNETYAAKIDFDFYEIDSWNAYSVKNGPDYFAFSVNGIKINLGSFSYARDEGTREGRKDGLVYRMVSLTKPQNIGYQKYADQKHRISVYVSRRVYGSSNSLTLGFEFISDHSRGISDEACGFDNIRVGAKVCKDRELPRPTKPPRGKEPSLRQPKRKAPKKGRIVTTPPHPTPKFWFVGKEEEVDFETSLEKLLSQRITQEVRAEFGGRDDCLYLQDPTVWVNLIEKKNKREAQC